MNIVIGTVLMAAAAAWLWRRLPDRAMRDAALRATWETLQFTLPRILVALVGAGLFAELLPADRVEALFGAGAGPRAWMLAIALGPVTPGGAFVSFAVGAAALKAGAAPVAVIAYVTSWALFSVTKMLAYEIPIMGPSVLFQRVAVSWPVPVVVALVAAWLTG